MAQRGRIGNNAREEYGVRQLFSRKLQVETKTFIMDVKEDKKGRFLQISEVRASGMLNSLSVAMDVASDLHEELTKFIEYLQELESQDESVEGDFMVKSNVIHAGIRRYYFDLRENTQGRFLKISMTLPPPSTDRQQIVLPANGLADVRDALTDILNDCSSSCEPAEEHDHDSKLTLNADSKVFQFEINDNQKGCCLRISEISPSFRTAISIPKSVWPQFREKLHEVGVSLRATAQPPCDQASADIDDTNSVNYYAV